MKVTFLPSNEANTAKIPGQDVAMIIAEPDALKDAPADKKWPVMFFLHGKDNLGGGTLSSLQTYWEGQFSGIPEDWKKAVDKYGIIGVALHYGGSLFSYNQWLWAYNFIRNRYNTYEKVFDAGFSWGGGSIQKCMCTMVEYCLKNALVMPIAPTVEYNGGWVIGADNRLPVWVVVNKGDNVTGTAAAKKIVDSINASGATIKATYTELNQNGHGGKNEAMGLAPMPGFAENVYELFLDILAHGPRVPKTGTAPTVPTTPTTPIPETPTTGIKADFNLNTNDIIPADTFILDASASTGVKTGSDGYVWDIMPVTGPWTVVVGGGAWGGPKKTLSKLGNGTYKIKLTVKDSKGATATKEVLVTVNLKATEPAPVVPKPINFKWPDTLVFDNGTEIKVTAKFTAQDGTVY